MYDPGDPPETSGLPIKLVAIDLDGTLLNDSKKVSEKTVEALCGLPERGVKVVIATARPPRSVRHVYTQLRLDTWQINYNGAMIWDEPARRAVFHRPMPPKLVRSIIDRCRLMFDEVLVSVEVMDKWYTDRSDNSLTTETGKIFKPDFVGPLDEFVNQDVTKLMLLGQPYMMKQLDRIVDLLYGDKVAHVSESKLLQVMDRRVSKSTALMKLARHYGVPMEQVMAIGDAPNDVGMLQVAGVGVAMDNAHPRVKEVSHWVAPSNNDHGVHAALVRYGLCN